MAFSSNTLNHSTPNNSPKATAATNSSPNTPPSLNNLAITLNPSRATAKPTLSKMMASTALLAIPSKVVPQDNPVLTANVVSELPSSVEEPLLGLRVPLEVAS